MISVCKQVGLSVVVKKNIVRDGSSRLFEVFVKVERSASGTGPHHIKLMYPPTYADQVLRHSHSVINIILYCCMTILASNW